MHFLVLQTETTDSSGVLFGFLTLSFLIMLAQVLLVALWLALVFWTYKDAKRRITDPLLLVVAVATSLIFPFVGTLFYTILRPPEYLEDVLERDLEIRAREQELVGGGNRCPACRMPVRDDFVVCPKCRRQLKQLCGKCSKPLDPSWRVCPYCETDVRAITSTSAASTIAEEDELFA